MDFIRNYEKEKRGFVCVPNMKYANKDKFVFGAVLNVNGMSFFVPVSTKNNKNEQYNLNISTKDRSNSFKASLRFQFMFPVPNNCLMEQSKNEIYINSDAEYKGLVAKELAFCRRNKDKIEKMAQKTYDDFCNKKIGKLENNFCDFKLLEEAYREFCGLTAPKQDQPTEQMKTVETAKPEADKTLDAVIEILDETIAEKNEAISERNKAIAERDEALAEFKQFRSEAMANSEEFNAIMKENPALKAAFKAARERHLESKDQKPTMPDKSAPNDTQTVKPKKPKR